MSELIDVAEDVQEAAAASVLIAKAKEVQKAAAEAALAKNAPKPSMALDRNGGNEFQAAKYNNNDWPDNPIDHHAISGIPDAFAYIAEWAYSGLSAKKGEVKKGNGILALSQGAFGNLTALLRDDDKFDGRVVTKFCTEYLFLRKVVWVCGLSPMQNCTSIHRLGGQNE